MDNDAVWLMHLHIRDHKHFHPRCAAWYSHWGRRIVHGQGCRTDANAFSAVFGVFAMGVDIVVLLAIHGGCPR